MQLKGKVDRMHLDLYGADTTPEAGFLKRFDTFMTDRKAREEERAQADAKRDEDIEKRHKDNRFFLKLIVGLIIAAIPAIPALIKFLDKVGEIVSH